jgi:hypothetical protein
VISDRRAIEGFESFGLSLYLKTRMTLQQTGAPVPAKKSIVVVWGTNHLGFGEATHRLRKERGEGIRRASYAHLRLRSPFMQETGVIKALVGLD